MRLEHTLLTEMSKQLPSSYILHKEINVFTILIHALEVDLSKEIIYDKRMVDRLEDLVLVADMINLLCFDKLDFFHYFCAVVLSIIFAFY